MKHEYRIESWVYDKWVKVIIGSLRYLQGYLDARKESAPRNAFRIMRSDGKVMELLSADSEVRVGMIAGWPTAEQYVNAAIKALQCAKDIQERQSKQRTAPPEEGNE